MNRYLAETLKVEYIKNHVINYKKIQPFLDLASVEQIKRDLHDNGFYKAKLRDVSDTAVINLILIAQGKKRFMCRGRQHGKRWK